MLSSITLHDVENITVTKVIKRYLGDGTPYEVRRVYIKTEKGTHEINCFLKDGGGVKNGNNKS